MRAGPEGRLRTATEVDGQNAVGSVAESGCCGIEPDSHGSRRTGMELVKSPLRLPFSALLVTPLSFESVHRAER
jgi:hypothetical protein